MKKHWTLPVLAVLLALVFWCSWYSRPVNIFDLKPELDPAIISVRIQRFGSSAQNHEHRDLDMEADTPEGQVLLEQLETIRLRRSPLNPLRSILPSIFGGRQTTEGQYGYVIHVFGTNGWIALQFFLDEWDYNLSGQGQYLPCRVADGEVLGQSLGDQLWESSLSDLSTSESNP